MNGLGLEAVLPDCGPMNDGEIQQACLQGELYISPYSEANLTPLGYNFKPSGIIISTKTGLPLPIKEHGAERYVLVKPHDTILVTSEESLFVGKRIFGTFHAKVKLVSQGFSHISTTLDPLWKGPLLFAITNGSSYKKKFYLYDTDGPVTFATLIFYRLHSESKKSHDNPPSRTDVLERYLREPNFFVKSFRFGLFKEYQSFLKGIKDENCNIKLNTFCK